jgi:divalent metal cation (Fe/Co/Zn/Cd) transporter
LGALDERRILLRRALTLQWLLLGYNVVEGIVAVIAGVFAGSVALTGFGVDSFVETASTLIVGWRLHVELQGHAAERVEALERRTARLAGALLLALAVYLLTDSARRILGYGEHPSESTIGLLLTALSLILMPVLGLARLRLAERLHSRALRADAWETLTCAWLSLTTLIGLSLNAVWGWWWADPVAGLVLIPFIVREGLEGWRGGCCCADGGEAENTCRHDAAR